MALQSTSHFVVLTRADDGQPLVIRRDGNHAFSSEGTGCRIWTDGRATAFLVMESAEEVIALLSS